MVIVAVLLLPLLAALLMVMDRVEERLLDSTSVRPRHTGRRRHLRLIPGGRQSGPEEHTRAVVEDGAAEAGRRAA